MSKGHGEGLIGGAQSEELAKAGDKAPAPKQQPTVGRIVQYRLSADDAEQANRRRVKHDARQLQPGGDEWPRSAQAHVGNEAHEGDVVPMLVVKVWDPSGGSVNGQAFLDGNDVLWVTSRTEGTAPGTWTWPARS
jgi:hypothetical protein